jgi:riboflavin biosynthesis pyrimidine reductase
MPMGRVPRIPVSYAQSLDGRIATTAGRFGPRQGYGSRFVEGGAQVINRFLRAGLLRRLLVVVAPLGRHRGRSAIAPRHRS